MKAEYDFSQGKRGQFFRPNARFYLPEQPSANTSEPVRSVNGESAFFTTPELSETGLTAHAE
ncbi:MAG: hypothetical protein AAF669_02105 [Pseudomonadota bacterium]